MATIRTDRKLHWLFALVLFALLLTISVSAQDAAPEATPESTPEPVQEVTAAPLPTEVPTDPVTEAPTVTLLPPPAESTPESTAPAEQTAEPALPPETTPEASTPVPTATLDPDALPPEPPLTLLLRELFDNGDLSPWGGTEQWALVAYDGGLALQTGSGAGLTLLTGSYYNAAAQINAAFVPAQADDVAQGSLHLTLRQNGTLGYRAALDASGQVVLYRGETPVDWTTAVLPPGGTHTLRLSVIEGVVRVSVNNIEVLAWRDAAPLPPGAVALLVGLPPDAGSVLLDNFFLWIPTSEAGLYPTPTSVTPAPVQTADAQPIVEVTEAPAPVEPELTPETTSEPGLPPADGEKSRVPVTVEPPAGILAVNDDFPAATLLSIVPSVSTGSSSDSTVVDEPVPTCGFNIQRTVWFRFTAPAAGQYVFFTAGSSFDTMLVAYSGSSLNALTQLACSDDVTVTDRSSRVLLNLTSGQVVHFQLGGYNGASGDYVFSAQLNTVPLLRPPTLNAPANRALLVDPLPALAWTAPAGTAPAYYHLQLDDDPRFGSMIINDNLITTLSRPLPYPPLADGVYYWRVASININGVAGGWSAVFSFTVDNTAPNPPELLSLINNTTTYLVRPALSWRAAPGANRYRLRLLTGDGSVILNDFAVNSTRMIFNATSLPTPLAQGRYRWQVAAGDAAGNWSPYGAEAVFIVNLASAPAADFAIVTGTSARPTFVWQSAGVAGVTYTLQIASDEDFTNIVYTSASQTTLRLLLPAADALPHGEYWWRVNVSGQPELTEGVRRFSVTPALPPAPRLLSPVNRSTTGASPQYVAAEIADTTPAGPFSYQFQVAHDARFTQLAVDQTIPDGDVPVDNVELPAQSLSDGLYYWRVRTLNTYGAAGRWSAVYSFTLDTGAPRAPELLAPAEGTPTHLVRPTLVWRGFDGAVRYRVTLSTSSDLSSPLLFEYEVAAPRLTLTAAVLPTPLAQGVYYWSVAAMDAANHWGTQSPVSSFVVRLPLTPAGNAALVTANTIAPTFTWATAGLVGASYVVEIATDSSFGNIIHTGTPTTATAYRLPAANALGHGEYYWRLLVNGVVPPPESSLRFAVTTSVLPAPLLTSPNNGVTLTTGTPTLQWTAVTGNLLCYRIEIDNTANFSSPEWVYPCEANSALTIPGGQALTAGRWYWRVRGVDTNQAAGRWSAARFFIVQTTPLAAPTLLTPAHNTNLTGLTPRFTWRPVLGAANYELQWSTDENFGNAASVIVPRTTYSTLSPLPPTTFYWRVRALDGVGLPGGWSAVFTLKLMTPASVAPVLNRQINNPPTLTWTRITWAQAYEIQIARDLRFVEIVYSNNVLPPNATVFTLPEALPAGTYFWRIRAQSGPTTWSGWSTTGTMLIDETSD